MFSGAAVVEYPSLRVWERDEWPEPDSETSLQMLERMVRIRSFDKLAVNISKSGEAPGSVHPYVGQEAIAVGVCAALGVNDFVTSTHRGHGHSIARGADPYRMFAEVLGRENGYARGKGGSMHIADPDNGNLGTNGIAGGGVPIAVGGALASWAMHSSARVGAAFFGDGAANEGSVHESMNLAAALGLPCVFVCENNLYSISVRITKAAAQPHIGARAAGYGMSGFVVDGQDCLAVYAAASRAATSARSGNGPSLIECKTYSYLGHSTFSRPRKPQEETKLWMARDPIDVHREKCLSDGVITAEDFDRMAAEVDAEINDALEAARRAEPTPVKAMLEDVFETKKTLR